MNRPPRQSSQNHKGSILVLVLAFVILLTFIVTAFLEDASSRIKYYGLFHNRDDLRVDAYSALETSLAVLNTYREVESALWGPEQGWGNPLADTSFQPANAASVSVEFIDESARLPLNDLSYDELLDLFELLDFDLSDAESLADGFLDWTDEDNDRRLNGFDGDDYEDREPPYRPANAPVESFAEMRLIRPFDRLFFDEETGRPLPLWNRFRNAVSLYNSGPVNINSAPALVMDWLYERGLVDPYAVERHLLGRDGEPGTEDDRLLRQDTEGILLEGASERASTELELLRVKVTASRGQARFVLEAMVEWIGANPGAGRTASSNQRNEDTANQPNNRNSNRNPSRSNTRTDLPSASDLGYPFRILRLLENRNF